MIIRDCVRLASPLFVLLTLAIGPQGVLAAEFTSARVASTSAPVGALLVALQQPASTDEFVPVKDLPPSEQLPAAPLLIVAYVFIWLVLLVYVVTLWRRLTRVEHEMATLSQRVDGGQREPVEAKRRL